MAAQSQSIPPKIGVKASPVGIIVSAFLILTFLGAGAVLFFFNPNSNGFYPVCPFHRMTGLNCPGCGGTRSAYALLHGNFLPALKDNALFVSLLPVLALRGAWLTGKKLLDRPVGQFFPAKFLWWLLVAVVVFTVLRNLPGIAFLSP